MALASLGHASQMGSPMPGGAASPMPPGAPMAPLMPMPGNGSPMPPGAPPQLTTQGMPDPAAISRQKEQYLKMLDEQLKQGINVLDQQTKYQRDYLAVQCEQQKKQFLLQLDQQMKAQEMVLTQQYNEQLMALQMSAGQQKAALEQQAMQLAMEYEQRKAEETMYRQQYEIQRQQMDMAMKMAQDYSKIGPPPGSQSPAALQHSLSYLPAAVPSHAPHSAMPMIVSSQHSCHLPAPPAMMATYGSLVPAPVRS